ncbi:hypothetical protein HK098_005974, partial [Nowakowskiella sp. JEL0407]
PQGYVIPDGEGVNTMDVILDLLPHIRDSLIWDENLIDDKWQLRRFELLRNQHETWVTAQLALDIMLNTTLGWERVVEGEIDLD